MNRNAEFAVGYKYKLLPRRAELFATFNELPPSVLKHLLVARVQPYFSNTPPKIMNTSGIPIELNPPIYKAIEVPPNRAMGHGTLLEEIAEEVRISETRLGKVPYPGYLTPQEAASITTRFPDGSVYIELELPAGGEVAYKLQPRLILDLPSPSFVARVPEPQRTIGRKLVKFLMMKEAATILAIDLSIEFMAEKMRQRGESQSVKAARKDGSQLEISVLPQVTREMGSKDGRYWSSIDKAGVVLGYHAIKGSGKAPDFLKHDSGIAIVQSDLDRLILGTTPIEIYQNTMRWCATPISEALYHRGNMNSLP